MGRPVDYGVIVGNVSRRDLRRESVADGSGAAGSDLGGSVGHPDNPVVDANPDSAEDACDTNPVNPAKFSGGMLNGANVEAAEVAPR